MLKIKCDKSPDVCTSAGVEHLFYLMKKEPQVRRSSLTLNI